MTRPERFQQMNLRTESHLQSAKINQVNCNCNSTACNNVTIEIRLNINDVRLVNKTQQKHIHAATEHQFTLVSNTFNYEIKSLRLWRMKERPT